MAHYGRDHAVCQLLPFFSCFLFILHPGNLRYASSVHHCGLPAVADLPFVIDARRVQRDVL